ncbi:MAG TPA: RidA family protein [Patescibacteria group bacterium]|nr:RidA family protein [Patescibacteria group bacterium]
MKSHIHTNDAPQPIGPYSQGIAAQGTFLFLSGQIPLQNDGTMIEGGIREQTHQVIRNIQAVLAAENAELKNVVKCTVFLKDMNDFVAMNEVFSEYFGDVRPARSTIEVARLPKDVAVEIEVIALRG